MSISIIIPTFNEEKALSKLLPYLNGLEYPPDEIIIVDGGSTDKSKVIAIENNVRFLPSDKRGRAAQLHLGAMTAKHDLICFLHADTFPNPNFLSQIKKTLINKAISLGGFVSIMRGERTRYWISYLNYVKTYFCALVYSPKRYLKGLRLLFGDQVMFCRKIDYFKSGGFDENDMVMEEANFCLRMSKLGRIKQLHHLVYSSDRRVVEWGFWKSNKIYIGIAMGWSLKLSTARLDREYGHVR